MPGRDAAHQYLADVIEVVVAPEGEEAAAEICELMPEYDYRGAYGGGTDHYVELQCLVCREVYSQYRAEYLKMAAGAYRKIFGESLHNAQDRASSHSIGHLSFFGL